MLCGRPLIPSLVNTHSITNDPIIVLDAMHLEAGRIVHSEVHKPHWRKEGKHYGGRRCGRQAFVAGDVPVMLAERASALPLDDGIHQQPHHGEHG